MLEGQLVLEQADLGMQNPAFEYKRHQTSPLLSCQVECSGNFPWLLPLWVALV